MIQKTWIYRMWGLILTAVILAAAGACPTEPETGKSSFPSTNGYFEVTGLPDSDNGKYALVMFNDGTKTFLGIKGIDDKGLNFKCTKIAGGTVKIPLYLHHQATKTLSAYSEDETIAQFVIRISDTEEVANDYENVVQYLPEKNFSNVLFEKGRATRPYY